MEIEVRELFRAPLTALLTATGPDIARERTRKAFEKLIKKGCHAEWLLELVLRVADSYRKSDPRKLRVALLPEVQLPYASKPGVVVISNPTFEEEIGISKRGFPKLLERLRGWAEGISSLARDPALSGEPRGKGLAAKKALLEFIESVQEAKRRHERERMNRTDPPHHEKRLLDYVKRQTGHHYRDDVGTLLEAACFAFIGKEERQRVKPSFSGRDLLKRQKTAGKG